MDQPTVDRLGRLNRYQIAALAFITSAVAAVAVLLAIRRFLFTQTPESSVAPAADRRAEDTFSDSMEQPDTPEAMGTAIPHHFSEDLIVPGLTKTGPEILQDDDQDGRSPEGV